MVLDAGSHLLAGVRSADTIKGLSPKTKIILMVGPEERPEPKPHAEEERQFLIKAMFTRNLLYLLEKDP